MARFRERNPIPIALIGIGALLVLFVLAFNVSHLPVIGAGHTITADFASTDGLKKGDDVRIAGIRVGKVTGITLHRSVVRVSMTDKSGVRLGRQVRAELKLKSLLGQQYVDLIPAGGGDLEGTIPVSRTTTPLIVTEAFIGLGQRAGDIDTKALAQSFDTLAATFKDTPKYNRAALQGLARVSQTIASRDEQLSQLLAHANGVTGVLASDNQQIARLIQDADSVLTLVEQQRAVIHDLLVNTSDLSQQLTALVQENRKQLGPALANLDAVATILDKHQSDLDTIIHELAPFVRDFDNTLGNGPWFDNFIANLTTTGTVRTVPDSTAGTP